MIYEFPFKNVPSNINSLFIPYGMLIPFLISCCMRHISLFNYYGIIIPLFISYSIIKPFFISYGVIIAIFISSGLIIPVFKNFPMA